MGSAIPLTPPSTDSVTGLPEQAIVAGVRQGDPAMLAIVFRGYFPILVAFARGYVASIDDAEELVAALFARLWEHRATWTPRHTIRSYLFAGVRNAALNVVRLETRQARREAAFLFERTTEEATPRPDETGDDPIRRMSDELDRALDHLPPTARTLIELRWERRMSYDEIAEVLGGTAASVQRLHSRTIARLRTFVVSLAR